MLNFGVREVANSKSTAAPGWAYVPDTGTNTSVAALQPSSRKRPRTQIGSSSNDTTAKQDAKLARDLAALDRENHKDVSIPVPIRHRDNAGRVSHGKVTPGVRKILQSAKTFANHLADYEAFLLLPQASQPAISRPAISTPATPIVRASPGSLPPHLTSKGTRSHKKRDPNAVAVSTPLRKVSSASQVATPVKAEPAPDTSIMEVAMLSMGTSTLPTPHPGDDDPLLISRIPTIPTQAEIEKLLAAPPLTYMEARGPWVEEDRRKPIRRFCEICGYWGRIRCKTCGGRVCALECLNVHQEECFTKYGS